MALSIGPREIILSGTLVFESGNPLAINIRDLRVVLEFDEKPNVAPTVDAQSTGAKELKFIFSGFSNSLGTAYDTQVGEIDGKPLVMAVYVFALGDERRRVRLLTYTFSVGEGHHE